MKKSDIEKALAEIGEGLCSAGIDRVYQPDSHTFLFILYGVKEWKSLLISLKRNALRLHLLFDSMHRDYYINTPAAAVLSKYCSRAKILSMSFNGRVVELLLLRGVEHRLLADMDSRDLQLREGENEIFQLNRETKGAIPSPGADEVLSFSRNSTERLETGSREGKPFLNRRLSDEYIRQQNDALARKILSVLRRERKKLVRLMEKLLEEQREVRDKEQYKLMGELLKYNLSRVKRGDRSVSLTGFDGKPMHVDLDPMLGPRENMNRYFQQYRKLKRREEVIDRKIGFEEKRTAALDELMDLVHRGEAISINRSPLQFVESIDPDLLTRGLQERVRRIFYPEQTLQRDEKKKEKFLRFNSKSGKTILIGRNARENDELTLRVARGNDLWLHVETGSGSHVILRYDRGSGFQDADIVDAAMLALYFSNFRNEKSGDVVYTQRKYIRKSKNKPAGYVTYHNNKTKHIRVDQHVLQRLLDSRPGGLMLQP